jgi:hypothetical protein
MASTTRLLCGVCALLLAVSLLGGCGKKLITSKTVRKNVSPSLKTSIRTAEQQRNHTQWLNDVDARQFEDDLEALFLIDRPSYLTPYPIP